MKQRICLLVALILILHAAIAHAAPPPSLTVSTVQHGATAQLLIGTFDASPTELQISLPAGWGGAPATVVLSGTAVVTFDLARGVGPSTGSGGAAPQLGVVVVRGGGMQAHAYLAGPVIESAPPRRAGRVLLAMVRR